MKKLLFTLLLSNSVLSIAQSPNFFYNQNISVSHGTTGPTLGFRLSRNLFVYCEYKFEFFPRYKTVNEKRETFWTDVPQWYSKYSQPHPNQSIYVIGSWGNIELARGTAKESYYSKFGYTETKVSIFNFGMGQSLSNEFFLQYGLGVFRKSEQGSIDEFHIESTYDVHKVYDTWHVIHPPGHYYLLTSNRRGRILTDKTHIVNNRTLELNINLVLNYVEPTTGWIYNVGFDSKNGLSLGFGLSF